jgi:hypothetical protein
MEGREACPDSLNEVKVYREALTEQQKAAQKAAFCIV